MNRDAIEALFDLDDQREDAFGIYGLSSRARRRLQVTRPLERPLYPPSAPTSSEMGKTCSQT